MVEKKTKPNSETPTTEDNKDVEVKTDEQPPKDEKIKMEEKTETKTDESKQPKKEEKVETYKDAIEKVTAKYEKKLQDQKSNFEKKIKERDDVIAEMLVDENNGKSKTPKTSIHDVIMKRRSYNKW